MATTHLTSENFEDEINKSNIPVVVDFYADWCMPCRMMAPVFEKLSEQYKGKMKFMKVDTEKEYKLASEFGIMGIPTLIIMYRGKEIGRNSGFAPSDLLIKYLDEALHQTA